MQNGSLQDGGQQRATPTRVVTMTVGQEKDIPDGKSPMMRSSSENPVEQQPNVEDIHDCTAEVEGLLSSPPPVDDDGSSPERLEVGRGVNEGDEREESEKSEESEEVAADAEEGSNSEDSIVESGKHVKLERAKEHSDVVNLTSAFVVDARDEVGNPLISGAEDLVAVLKGL